MDDLAPAARVRALREPASPVLDGAPEVFVLFLLGERDPAAATGLYLPEHEHRRLALVERKLGDGSARVLVQWGVRREPQADARRPKARAFGGDLRLVPFAGVVEGRGALHPERHLAPHHPDPPDELVVAVPVLGGANGHVVDELPDTLGREEARNEDVRIRPVELLVRAPLRFGRYLEAPTLLVVQDGREDARRVEVREAQPVYGAVRPDQGGAVHVADDPVLLYRSVGHGFSATSSCCQPVEGHGRGPRLVVRAQAPRP